MRPSLSLLFTKMLAGTSSAPLMLVPVTPAQTHVCAQGPLPVLPAWPNPQGLEQGGLFWKPQCIKAPGCSVWLQALLHLVLWTLELLKCPPVLRTPHQNSWMSVGSACKPTFGEITRGIHPPSLPAKPMASHSGEFDPYRCSPPVQHP